MKLLMLMVALGTACSAQQVRFPVVVLDRDERFIKNLNASHFRLSEDGVQQTVESAEITPGGISLGVVADKSNSVRGPGSAAQNFLVQGLAATVDQSSPEDNFFVVLISSEAFLACDFTRDANLLAVAFSKLKFQGGTALWDSLAMAVDHLDRAKNAKRGILLVSDGEDNNSRRSRTDFEELLKRSGLPLFVFTLDNSTVRDMAAPVVHLANNSGGRHKKGGRVADIGGYIIWVRDFLRSQYTLTYTPTKPGPTGKWRKVKVQVTPPDGRKGVNVVAPSGYYFTSSPGR